MAKVHGPRIKAARGYAGGISAAELGSRIGVSESTIKRWEGGDPSLTAGYRIAIADVCGVPADFMETGWGDLPRGAIERRLNELSSIGDDVIDRLDKLEKALGAHVDESVETVSQGVADLATSFDQFVAAASPEAPPEDEAATTGPPEVDRRVRSRRSTG